MNDLPRVDICILVCLQILTQPKESQESDLSKSLQRQIQEAIRAILEKSLPYWEKIKEFLPSDKPEPKRRRTAAPPLVSVIIFEQLEICRVKIFFEA